MFWTFLAVALAVAAAQYGGPNGPEPLPVPEPYPQPADYPQPARHPLPVPVYHSHHYRSRSDSRSDERDSCGSLKAKCKRGDSECERAEILYFHHHGREYAVATCEGEDLYQITTRDDDVLARGRGISKLLKCRNGRWRAEDIEGNKLRVKSIRCKPWPVTPVQTLV